MPTVADVRRIPASILREALLPESAAVRLLVGHGRLLTRKDFLLACVVADQTAEGCWAWIDWACAGAWAKRTALSTADKAVLDVALLLAQGDLSALGGGLARLVVLAVVEASGLDESAIPAGIEVRS
jgi:hypothetical protein